MRKVYAFNANPLVMEFQSGKEFTEKGSQIKKGNAKVYLMKYLILLMFFVSGIGAKNLLAQPGLYNFSNGTDPFTLLSGATAVTVSSNDDGISAAQNIGFTFNFAGTNFTQFKINTNGWITFDVASTATTNYSSLNGTVNNVIAAYNGDLTSAGNALSFLTTGTAGSQICKIEWKNTTEFSSTEVPDLSNFQIWLYEGTNVIEVRYGSFGVGTRTLSQSPQPQVGLHGTSTAAAQILSLGSSAGWGAAVYGNTSTTTMPATTTILPDNGRKYTFTPPAPCVTPGDQPTSLSLSAINASQIDGSFTAATSAPNGYLVVRYISGATPTNPSNGSSYTAGAALGAGIVVQSGTSTSFSATGLTPLTFYDFYIYSLNSQCTGGPLYQTGSPLFGTRRTPAQTPPNCATTFTPANGAANVAITQVLSWSGATGSPAVSGYNVYFSTNSALVTSEDPSVLVSANQVATTYTPSPVLAYGQTYYWKINPINSIGAQTGCIVNSFSTYVPVSAVSTAIGGLWSSPATWASGIVPIAGDNVTIADGAIVTVDQLVTGINSLTVGQGTSGILQWGGTSFAMTVFGNLTVNTGAKFSPHTTGLTGQTLNIGGNLVNNGFANLATPSTLVNFNGSQQLGGSLSQNLSGTGSFLGNGTNGIVARIFFQTTGSSSITTTQNLTTTSFAHTAGTVNTNAKLTIDNTAQVYGQAFNTQVANIAVTNMGTGYTSAPVVFGAISSAWTAGGTATVTSRYYSGGNVYLCTTGGTFDAVNPPTHTSGIVANGTASLLWLAPEGTLGNPFSVAATTVGTQYFYGGNLYVCTVAGTPDATVPPVHLSGTAVSGAATFLYVGTPASVSVNYDAGTSTVRSLNIINTGSGYSSAPTVTLNGGGGSGAVASSVLFQSIAGPANSLTQRSGSATISGGLTINNTQGASAQTGVGNISTTNGGVNYTVAPTVGFAGPPGINLVTAGGSGFTSNPTITVTGGTLISGTALTTSNFTITVNQGKVVSVYLNTGTTATYSVPPTLAFSGGAGTGATLAFPAGCWPTATASIGSNGQITNFTVTNSGFGYITAPTVGIGATSGTPEGGTFTTIATTPTCRVALYNYTISNFTPSPANVPATDDVAIPANRKINVLTIGTSTTAFGNLNLSGNLELIAAAPLTLTGGTLNLGGNNLLASWNGYAGQTGSLNSSVSNGSITLTTRGGGLTGSTLNFPFDATFTTFTGSGTTAANGASVLTVTASRTAAPTGTGNPIGTRAYRSVVNAGAVYGTNPTVTLNWNANDALVSDQAGLFVSQSAAVAGPWTTRSVTSGTGSLAATGSRTTAVAGVGPIVPTGDDYFAWSSTYVSTPLNYSVVRNTGITYNSIMATGTDLAWGTAGSVSNDDITASVSLTAIPGGAPTFTYQGQPITGFSMCSNGWVKLNTATSAATTSTSFSNNMASIANIIAPFWEDLSTNPNLGSQAGDLARLQASMKYRVNGTTAGSRQFVIEWRNMTVFGAGGPQLNFQVVLDETNNSIAINYGLFQGFNGTNNHRYSYSAGLSGQIVNLPPLTGQLMAQQYENTTAFSHEFAATANSGVNGLLSMPVCNTALVFTPGVYGGFTPPANTPPVNDEAAGAITVTALTAFPANLCGNFYTSRNATASSQTVCNGNNDDDVWFKFTANEVNTTVRVYGAGGYIPRVQVLDASLNPLTPAQCVVASAGGGTVDANLTGLTVSNLYYIRVYHEGGGTQATINPIINGNGQLVFSAVTNGGSGYLTATTGSGSARVRVTGGGGRDAAGTASITAGAVTGITMDNVGFGFTGTPTVTIEKPNWSLNGEFALVVYAPQINDECSGAKALTNLSNSSCVIGQNSLNDNSGSATPSAEAVVCGTPDDDVWFKFTAINTNTHIDVTGTGSYDAAFQVFNGGVDPGSCGAKTSVACINVNGAGALDSTTVATIIGNTYFVRVYHAATGTVPGETFNICVYSAPPPCVTTPIAPTNGGNSCAGTTTLSWAAVPYATQYEVYLDAGAGPATTLVATQAGTSFTTGVLTAGPYAWRIVPINVFGAATGCTNFTFTVNALPTVSITPVGPITICAPATQTLSSTTSAASPTYQWVNAVSNTNITGQTASSYIVNTSGSFRLVATDGVTGCRDSSNTVFVTVNLAPVIILNPTVATISCDSVKISSFAGGSAAIKITEVTLFSTGTGQTPVYPAYAVGADFVEISNISGNPINVGGYIFNDFANSSASIVHPYSIPLGTIIPANSILTLHLGTGTDDVANRYFNTGGSSDNWSSSSQAGFVLKDPSGNIVDVVGCGGSASGSYTFDPATGVSGSDWSGFAPNVGGFAGIIRVAGVDNNAGSDWVQSNSPTPLQSIGTYNGGYTLSPLPVSWSPVTGLFTDAALTTPYTTGTFAELFAKPGLTTTYTVTAAGTCPGTNSIQVTVSPASSNVWTGALSTDWNNAANWSCGGIPTITSEVVIPTGAPRYPIITLNVEIKKLTVDPGASVTVATGFDLKLNGL